jgi:exodeoxyribonuclease-1
LSSSDTLYWHDYETFGTHPAIDRPVQFAGQRTTLDLQPVGEPLVIFARPPRDYLPNPEACLVTGITPQLAEERGVCESDFMGAIHAELAAPGTCALGYNSLRFDDEFTRYGLYRNLLEPYAREYENRCSRWDLIDVVRTAYALRPDGIEWPRREDGLPSFRLEDLTAANGIEHSAAHDALGDVRATIAIAALIRERQPRLYQHLFEHRSRQAVQALVDVREPRPLLHVSGMFGAARANLGLILPLFWHPQNRNELVCCDLSMDPAPLLQEPPDRLRELLYTRSEDLGEDEARPGLKSVHANRCPVLLPPKMADGAVAERARLDGALCRRHLAQLREHFAASPGALVDKLRSVYEGRAFPPGDDPETQLYDGFLPSEDRQLLARLRALPPEELAGASAPFSDPRLPELLFRYRARNYPETLSPEERERWDLFRFQRITESEDPRRLDLEHFHGRIEALLADEALAEGDRRVLGALQDWGDGLLV